MAYPQKSDIIVSVKYLDKFIKDPVLKGGSVVKNSNQQPLMFTGGFSLVFQIINNNKKYAFRVWHAKINDVKKRFQLISKFLSSPSITYFSEFSFVEAGILVSGQLLDTSRMTWVEGYTLKEYIYIHLNNKSKLLNLADDFLEMTRILHSNSISHGDLQHGNIIINKKGEIKLIDYDSLYIPELKGYREIITGLKGYQHPARFTNKLASKKADYFSELIIYITILALIEDPTLWDKYDIGNTEVLLFTNDDFLSFNKSQIKSDLEQLSPKIDALIKVLELYLSETSIDDLLPFEDVLTALFKKPEITAFYADKTFLENSPNKKVIITWNTANANNIAITDIGDHLASSGKQEIVINKNITLSITANNALGKTVTDTIEIKVSDDIPEILKFSLSKNLLTNEKPALLEWEVKGAEIVNISYVGDNLPNADKKPIFTKNDITLELEAISYFGKTVNRSLNLKVSKAPPVIGVFSANFLYVIPNTEIEFYWKVKNAVSIEINDPDKKAIYSTSTNIGSFKFNVLKPGIFTLIAKTVFNIEAEKSFNINQLPIPIITSIQSNSPKIGLTTTVNSTNLKVPKSLINSRNIQLSVPLNVSSANIAFQNTHLNIKNINTNLIEREIVTINNPKFIIENNLIVNTSFNLNEFMKNIYTEIKKLLSNKSNKHAL